MDPVSILMIAKGSYQAIKAGIAVGKEMQGMAKDLGSLFESVAHITRIAAEPPHPSLLSAKSAEQIAMEAYTAKAEADQMMADLKNHFIGEFGIAAWDQILSETTKIKKAQKAAAIEAANRQEEFIDSVATWSLVFVVFVIALAGISLLALFLLRH